jgi:hypothetical protein
MTVLHHIRVKKINCFYSYVSVKNLTDYCRFNVYFTNYKGLFGKSKGSPANNTFSMTVFRNISGHLEVRRVR